MNIFQDFLSPVKITMIRKNIKYILYMMSSLTVISGSYFPLKAKRY